MAVARAVMWNSKCRDPRRADRGALGVAQIASASSSLVERLADQGLAVVIISRSNLPDVLEVATRITVLRLGRNVVVFEREKTTQHEVVRAITFEPAKSVSGRRQRTSARPTR